MKSLIYAIGDVHGKHELFEKLIHYYDPKIHQLVLLGISMIEVLVQKNVFY